MRSLALRISEGLKIINRFFYLSVIGHSLDNQTTVPAKASVKLICVTCVHLDSEGPVASPLKIVICCVSLAKKISNKFIFEKVSSSICVANASPFFCELTSFSSCT
jgi:hypothetical protein